MTEVPGGAEADRTDDESLHAYVAVAAELTDDDAATTAIVQAGKVVTELPSTAALIEVVEPQTKGAINLRAPELYLNRELTWLQFNFRVMNEARDKRTPLLERVEVPGDRRR